MDTSLALSIVVMVLAIVSTVAFFVIGGSTGETIQIATIAVMMPLMMWWLAREAFSYDSDARTVTFHLTGRR